MIRRIGMAAMLALVTGRGLAQGTKLWQVDRYDEMERGSADGISVGSDGEIAAGMATSLLYRTSASYVWSVAAGLEGQVVAGVGGTSAGMAAVILAGQAGQGQTIFEGKEMGVQRVRIAGDGTVYAATSPDGKVYRIGKAGAAATVLFDPSQTELKPKYLWDLALGAEGEVYVATGAPAAVYRVPAQGKAELLFKTADQHIRCLLITPEGMLWAGSDGSGVIYKIGTNAKGSRLFAVYAAPKREITSMAMDTAGNLYAAGVGTKATGSAGAPLQPLQVTNELGVTVTFQQPGSTSAAGQNAIVPEGSEVYQISPGGVPEKVAALKEDVVYALAVQDGALIAATGNRGRIYRVSLDGSGRYIDAARLDAAQGTAMAVVGDGLVIGTSNSGTLIRVANRPPSKSVYTSEVFDAGQVSQWGRLEVQAAGVPHSGFDLYVRSGNVPSPVSAWSDWATATPAGAVSGLPAGRYVQWKAEMRSGGAIRSVGLNYLTRNVAPVVDEVVVAPGARVVSTSGTAGTPPAVQVVFPAAAGVAQAISYVQDVNASPLAAQKDRTSVTVRWAAHDDNGDDLMFGVWYRGEGETNWRLLKDKISERFLSFDSSLLPDGRYAVKVVASDAPVHVEGEALTGSHSSAEFVVDTTPPVPGVLMAKMEGGRVHATLEASDAVSPVAHAEYSVDAGPWQYVEPVGGLSDSLTERYDVMLPVGTNSSAGLAAPTEHVVAFRVYDRFENMASAKAVVH